MVMTQFRRTANWWISLQVCGFSSVLVFHSNHSSKIHRFEDTAFSAMTLFVGQQVGHPACKKTWVVRCWHGCLGQGADLHMAQLMPLSLTVFCSSKIQIGFTFLVPAHLGSPGQRAI